MLHHKAFIGIIGLIVLAILTSTSVKAGNDFIVVDLRTDIPMVPNYHDYQVWLASGGGPTGNNNQIFTNAWISVDLDDEPGLYGHKFSQVGIVAYNDGLHWFVYAEPGVTCYYGEPKYGNLGCQGEVGEFVDFGSFYKVELVTYSGEDFWTARVEDSQGVSHTVAKILSDSKNVYDIDVNMEEGWNTTTDPYEFGEFHMWHPQYNSWIDGFREWPFSNSSVNSLFAAPAAICPQQYGAWINMADDPRYWAAGSGGSICNAIMFPANKIFLPSIMNE